MIGWVNKSVEEFIIDSFGEDKWNQILSESKVTEVAWVSSCAYADSITYDLIITGAKVLGVTVEQALEAYGVYFVRYTAAQGYTKLLKTLGSNVGEFLSNLNSLHLHLTTTFPAMQAPAFRCDKVTPESLELHYYSSRPGLWPIVVGVLKGLAKDHFKFNLNIELLQARGRDEGADHEAFLVTYPFQESLVPQRCPDEESDRLRHAYTLPPDVFHTLHPFHMLIDAQGRVAKAGDGLLRLFPNMRSGSPIQEFFVVAHPFISSLSIEAVKAELHSAFLLRSAQQPAVTLKGQMVLTRLAGGTGPDDAILFLGSPRCANLDELEAAKLFLSDFPHHDMGREFVLLAEQRQAEADLKERFEKLTLELKAEKARSDALLQRMSVLLACFPFAEKGDKSPPAAGGARGKADHMKGVRRGPSEEALKAVAAAAGGEIARHMVDASQDSSDTAGSNGVDIDHVEVIEAVRRAINPQLAQRGNAEDDIQMIAPISEGSYGKVYKGLWQGTEVAVKMMVLPANMSGAEKREKMAIMEAAISSTLSHPNIIQTYTYTIRPIRDSAAIHRREDLVMMGINVGGAGSPAGSPAGAAQGSFLMADASQYSQYSTASTTGGIHSYEVRLVLELCDLGSLRAALDKGVFVLPDETLNYHAVLDMALDIAKAMLHLHRQSILHSDLKSHNVMLKTMGDGTRVIGKVGDFGLSVKMDSAETHMSNMFQGTLTHMAPEVMLSGHISKSADVYAFGILLWELYTGGHPFRGLPRALLGHQVTMEDRRPMFPPDTPGHFKALAEWCWSKDPESRPSFVEILASLTHLRKMLGGRTPPVRRVIESPEHSCQLPGAIDAVQPLMCMPGSAGSGGPSGTGGGAGAMSTSPAMAAAAAAGCPHAAAALGLAPEVVRPTRLTVNLPPAVRNQSRVYRVSSSGNFGPGICSSAGHTDEDSQAADDSFAEGACVAYGSAILAETLADGCTL